MTLNLDLDFVKPKATDLSGPPHAHIYVKQCTASQNGQLKHITSDCANSEALEDEVNRLKKELTDILAKAKKKFAAL